MPSGKSAARKSPIRGARRKRRNLFTRHGALARSAIMSVRLDPRLQYLTEIAARKQRRTASRYIEWAIEKSLDQVQLADSPNSTVAVESRRLWDVSEPERFVRLATHYPALLTHDEQSLWRHIKETPAVWKDGKPDGKLLQAHWDKFIAVALGE